MPPKQAPAPVAVVEAVVEEKEPEKPEFGYGKFEYKDQTCYVGNWRLLENVKVKHGHGKITFPGVGGPNGKGREEYEGDWLDDKMHGYGRYQFTSGASYSGDWHEGKMNGQGSMINADGTSYEGSWMKNMMHGKGKYVDCDGMTWEGIFINGSYESKVQKKLQVEKEIQDRADTYKEKAKSFFIQFAETFARSDKKTFKDNLTPLFASAESCIDYVAEPYSRFDERPADKWNDLLKAIYNDGDCKTNVLRQRESSTVLKMDLILCEQMRSKKGGQLVEVEAVVADKLQAIVLCELMSETWVLVHCCEKSQ